jgi:hypothetical protein
VKASKLVEIGSKMLKLRSTSTSDSVTSARDVSLVEPTADQLLWAVLEMQAIFGAVEVRHISDSTRETSTSSAKGAIVICPGTWLITGLDSSKESA